jgi:hypothetical protein
MPANKTNQRSSSPLTDADERGTSAERAITTQEGSASLEWPVKNIRRATKPKAVGAGYADGQKKS